MGLDRILDLPKCASATALDDSRPRHRSESQESLPMFTGAIHEHGDVAKRQLLCSYQGEALQSFELLCCAATMP